MSKSAQFILLFVLYTIVISGTMFYSGRIAEKTSLYDRFLISLEGTVLPVANLERSLKFYTEVLDFRPLIQHSTLKPVGLLLPEKRKLFFKLLSEDSITSSPEISGTAHTSIVVRVKNGVTKLHSGLLARLPQRPSKIAYESYTADFKALPPETISNIIEVPWGKEFIVRDADGNSLIFYQPTRRSGSRL